MQFKQHLYVHPSKNETKFLFIDPRLLELPENNLNRISKTKYSPLKKIKLIKGKND